MKKLLALLLAVLTMLTAFSFVACGDKKEDEGDTAPVTNILFNGFEEFEKDFMVMRVVDWGFGSVDINRDKKYVKFGEASACFRPAGEVGYTYNPGIYIPTYSNRYEYNYRDMTKVEKISAWYYNAQETNYMVGISLQTTTIECNQTMDNSSRTVSKKYSLAPGWNYIEYKMDPKFLECNHTLDLTNVFGIRLEFDYVNQLQEESPYIYVDDIRFHLSEETVKGSETFGLKADANKGVWEIADFEDERQLEMFSVSNTLHESRRPTLEIVNANEVSVDAPSGKNVLKATRHSSYTTSHSVSFTLSGDVLREVFDTIGEDLYAHPEKYALKFDYCTQAPYSHTLNYSFMSSVTTRSGPSWAHSGTTMKPFVWTTFSRALDAFDTEIYKQLTAEDQKSTYPKLLDGYTVEDAKFSTNPGSFSFTMGAYPAGDRRPIVVIYDNIRIERIA